MKKKKKLLNALKGSVGVDDSGSACEEWIFTHAITIDEDFTQLVKAYFELIILFKLIHTKDLP